MKVWVDVRMELLEKAEKLDAAARCKAAEARDTHSFTPV